jgi:hypothetical protein
MRKMRIILAMLVVAIMAVPAAASADVARQCVTPLPANDVKTATFNATQPSGAGGNWVHHFTVAVNGVDGSFTGTNVITGMDYNGPATVNETVSGTITDSNGDGINEITVHAVRPGGLYTFEWDVTNAPMNGVADDMNAGTTSYVTAKDWTGGPLPITFTAPQFEVATADTQYANHGEYVDAMGGGKVAAQKCVGMPKVSNAPKTK